MLSDPTTTREGVVVYVLTLRHDLLSVLEVGICLVHVSALEYTNFYPRRPDHHKRRTASVCVDNKAWPSLSSWSWYLSSARVGTNGYQILCSPTRAPRERERERLFVYALTLRHDRLSVLEVGVCLVHPSALDDTNFHSFSKLVFDWYMCRH